MRVVFLTPWDPSDGAAWSGVLTPAFESLREKIDLNLVVPKVDDAFADRILTRLNGQFLSKSYYPSLGLATTFKASQVVRKQILDISPDVVFAFGAGHLLVGPKLPCPVVQFSEATFRSLVNYYPMYSNLSYAANIQGRIISDLSYRNTDKFIASSEWVRMQLSLQGRKHVTVAPIGPAIDSGSSGYVESPMRANGYFSILLVAKDWDRKDGDRAVAVARALHDRDSSVRLTVVGKKLADEDWISSFERVGKDELKKLYCSHDVLFEFTKANTGGVVIADSFSASLPVIATETGAVPSLVNSGKNGTLIGVSESVADVAMRVEKLKDPIVAERYRKNAFSTYSTYFNWGRWSDSVVEVLRSTVS